LYRAELQEKETYKNRFTGLQGKYQQESEKWKKDTDALNNLNTTVTTLTTAKTAAEQKAAQLAEEIDAQKTDLELANAQVERYTTVLHDFPQLLPFMDVLPDGNGDEFKARLKTFAERLNQVGATGLVNINAGGTPPSPPASAGSKADLLKQAQQAAHEGRISDYNTLYDQYLKAQ
jgi:chromosome segregation ATPase